MLKVAQMTIPDWYGFYIHKGAAFGNIAAQLYVYFGERSAQKIYVWTRAKVESHGSTTWHKVTITPEHKRWSDLDALELSVDYTPTKARQAILTERNEREQLRKELEWVDTLPSDYRYISRSEIKAPNTKGQLYALNGVQYRRLYALKTATAVVKTRNDEKAFEPIPLNKIN